MRRPWSIGATAPAPPPFSAASVPAAEARDTAASFGWLARLAGRCWRADHWDRSGFDRRCYAWQYANARYVSLESNVAGRAHGEERIYAPTGEGLTSFYWARSGDFGAASARFERETFVVESETSRTVSTPTRTGFRVVASQRREGAWQEAPPLDYRLETPR